MPINKFRCLVWTVLHQQNNTRRADHRERCWLSKNYPLWLSLQVLLKDSGLIKMETGRRNAAKKLPDTSLWEYLISISKWETSRCCCLVRLWSVCYEFPQRSSELWWQFWYTDWLINKFSIFFFSFMFLLTSVSKALPCFMFESLCSSSAAHAETCVTSL